MRVPAGRVGNILAIALSLSASATFRAGAEGPPELQLGETRLVGLAGERHPGIASFRRIPFAEPPVRDLRWRAPQPLALPAGRREATRFAADCFQDSYNTEWYRKVGAASGADAAMFHDPPCSENCLYLNVWMPATAGPGGERLGAYHGAEIPYVFDTHDDWMPGDADDRRLTERLMRFWTNFARNGDPNGDDLPAWPAYDAAVPQVMALGDDLGPRPAPEHPRCLEQANVLYGARP